MIKLLNILLRVKEASACCLRRKKAINNRVIQKLIKLYALRLTENVTGGRKENPWRLFVTSCRDLYAEKQTPLLQRYPLPAHLITYRDRLFRCVPRRVLFSNYLPRKLIRSHLLFLTNLSIINRIVLRKLLLKEIFSSNRLFVKKRSCSNFY